MSNQSAFAKYALLGVEVDALTIKQAVAYISDIASSSNSKALYVVKPYVEFLDKAKDPKIAQILNDAELSLADGAALVWGTHYLYGGKRGVVRAFTSLARLVLLPKSLLDPLPEVFRGINFTLELLRECEKRGLSVYLIGSPKHNTIADTAAFLKHKFPGIKITGHFTGKLNPELEEQLAISLNNSKPDVILVGMGFPIQEQLMARLKPQLAHGVMIGEGGSFDFRELGGRLPRAPRWIRTVHLEWLWRLMIEPWRFKRQLAILRHIGRVYRSGRV